jgi:hypothetical protein
MTPINPGTQRRVEPQGGHQTPRTPGTSVDPGSMDTPITVLEGREGILDGRALRQQERSTPPATRRGERSAGGAGASGQVYGSSMARLGNRFSAKRIVCDARTSYPHVRRSFGLPSRLVQCSSAAREQAARPIRLRRSRRVLPILPQTRRGWLR